MGKLRGPPCPVCGQPGNHVGRYSHTCVFETLGPPLSLSHEATVYYCCKCQGYFQVSRPPEGLERLPEGNNPPPVS